VHSLALRRRLFLEAGGLPPRYGDFGAWVLGIALDSRGECLVFSPRPGSATYMTATCGTFVRTCAPLARGDPLSRRFLRGARRPLSGTDHRVGGKARAYAGSARRALRSALAMRHPGTVRSGLRHLAVAVLGPRTSIWAARVGALLAGASARIRLNPERCADRFNDFWRLATRRGRLEGLAESSRDPVEPPSTDRIDLTEVACREGDRLPRPGAARGRGSDSMDPPLALIRVNVPGEGPMRARLSFSRSRDRPGQAGFPDRGR
jgi:hypothetical protein